MIRILEIFKRKKMIVPIKKIAIIVGHGGGDPGALGWNGMSEFNYNCLVAEEVSKSIKNKEVKLFYRGIGGILDVSLKVNSWQPDFSIELHCNAFNGKAKGCEALYVNNDSESLAKKFSKDFADKFHRVLRGNCGSNKLYKDGRGYGNLKNFNHRAILLEPFFIDSKEDWLETSDYVKFLTSWLDSL